MEAKVNLPRNFGIGNRDELAGEFIGPIQMRCCELCGYDTDCTCDLDDDEDDGSLDDFSG